MSPPSSRAATATDVAPPAGTPAQSMPAFSFTAAHARPHTGTLEADLHHVRRMTWGAAGIASPAAPAEAATPFLSSSAARSWSPERRPHAAAHAPEARGAQVLVADAQAYPEAAYGGSPHGGGAPNYQAANEYASAAREVNQALAAHYAQLPSALRFRTPSGIPLQEQATAGHPMPPPVGDDSSIVARAAGGEEGGSARQWSPTAAPWLPLQAHHPPPNRRHDSPPRTT